jgi:hypothetical protein
VYVPTSAAGAAPVEFCVVLDAGVPLLPHPASSDAALTTAPMVTDSNSMGRPFSWETLSDAMLESRCLFGADATTRRSDHAAPAPTPQLHDV